MLLVLSMTGLAAAATLVDDTTPATIATFEDLNGNGIDDDCETAAVPNADAVTAAMAAVDVNADGVISTTEAAHSSWVGGANCNHGGYVSTVAQGSSEACDEVDAPDATTAETNDESDDPAAVGTGTAPVVAADCTEDAPAATETDETAPTVCEVAPVVEGAPLAVAMTHVQVAQSDMVGGKNCNHGGAVSESAKAANAERKAARDAAREAKQAAREAKTHGAKAKHGKHHAQ